jgi:hypothetical protein
LAHGRRQDWEYYLHMNVVEFFNEMAFRKDKKHEQSMAIQKLIKGKTGEEAQVLLLAYSVSKL